MCRRVLGFISFEGPPGIVLKDRMHISTYYYNEAYQTPHCSHTHSIEENY